MLTAKDIDWILCDLGKTLVGFDHHLAVRNLLGNPALQDVTGVPTETEIFEFFFHSPTGSAISHAMDRGERDLAWLADQVRERFGLTIPREEVERAWSDIFLDEIPGVQAAMRRTQQKGVRVAICSNTNAAHIDQVRYQHPRLLEGWDRLFLSYEMHLSKGDPGFFSRIAEELETPPERILLVDDLAANINAAEREGVRGLLFTGSIPDWPLFS